MEKLDVNFPSSAKKRSFFEIIEEFKFEMKQMVDFLGLSNPKVPPFSKISLNISTIYRAQRLLVLTSCE